jgi:hypothetical protein
MSRGRKKKGDLPSSEEAEMAMESINQIQKIHDEQNAKNKLLEEEAAQKEKMQKIEQLMILEAQERIKKKLKENLIKKQKSQKEKQIKIFLESGNKVKWKSINNGKKLEGYINDKFTFEIVRGLNLFSLYVKDDKLKNDKKLNSYIGCSTNLQRLKKKSEKLL